MHEIIYHNLGVKIIFHDSYWEIVDLTDKLNKKTWAVYDKYSWYKKLQELNENHNTDFNSFLQLIKN